jgi:hypothetical protein
MTGGATEAVFTSYDSSLRMLVKVKASSLCRDAVAYWHVQSKIEIAVIQQPVPSNFNLMTTH